MNSQLIHTKNHSFRGISESRIGLFSSSLSNNRQLASEGISQYKVETGRRVLAICPDSKKPGNTSLQFNGTSRYFDDVLTSNNGLLDAGLCDSVVISEVDKIRESVSILLGVADCGAISGLSSDGKIMFMTHAGFKGTALDIIKNTLIHIERLSGFNFGDFSIDIGPMLGGMYEFSSSHYYSEFEPIAQTYGLNLDDYFMSVQDGKGYLDLNKMIVDLLVIMGGNRELINNTDLQTNDPENILPSYRLHTIQRGIMKKIRKYKFSGSIYGSLKTVNDRLKFYETRLNKGILSDIEIELFLSEHFWLYEYDPRLACTITNLPG